MSLETRLRSTGQQPGGGGGASSDSGGLAGTGGFYVLHTASDPTVFPNSRLLFPGANVSITTNGTQVIISANTGGASNSAGLAGTGGLLLAYSTQTLYPFSKVLTAGSSVTTHTDSTNFYINAITSLFAGSGGLASTGGFFVTYITDPTLSAEKILTAGSSISLRTDATSIYIDAQTGGGSSVVYAPTGGFYLAFNSDSTLVNEKILRAGTNISVVTDSTFFFINANTGAGGSSTPGTYEIMPQQAKLYANNSAARIDAGTPFFRLLFSPTTQQYGTWSFIVPADYSSNPYMRIYYGADSTIASARSVSWIVQLWGIAANQGRAGGYYADTFGASNTVSVALSAGYSSGTIQMLTVPLANAPSLGVSRLLNLRLSGSGGAMGNSEFVEGTFEYTKA